MHSDTFSVPMSFHSSAGTMDWPLTLSARSIEILLIVYCLKTIRCYKGDLADLLANKWKPSEAALVPILA